MNEHTTDDWQDLARVWQTSSAPVTRADIEQMQERQRRRVQAARAAELACALLGVLAALWLALASRYRWIGILTTAFSVASMYFMLRAQRRPAPQGSANLLESLKDLLDYQDWLATQLRYGRALGFIALFAVLFAASTQLLHMAGTPRSGLLATAGAAVAIGAALSWNMTLAWQVWRRAERLAAFRAKLLAEQAPPTWLRG